MPTQDERFRAIWDIYAKAWSGVSSADRSQLLDQSVHLACIYTDPLTERHGHVELIAYMEQFQKQLPGGAFVTLAFDHHHNQALAHWNMVDANGTILNPGASFARFEGERLIQMTGFFPPPDFN